MNREDLERIFSSPIEDIGLMRTLSILGEYVNVQLLMGENNNIYYKVLVDELLRTKITEKELLEVRQGGWELDISNLCLIKNF